jgi:hypothetical protein
MAQTNVYEEAGVGTHVASRAKDKLILAVSVLIFISLLAFIATYHQTPAAASADVPTADFSSERALKHVKAISRRPHPTGSSEHAKVREYIVKELAALGINAEIQRANVVSARQGGLVEAGTVQNVVARLNGTDSRKAVMLVGHYDSAPTSLGASDDGSAIGAMLESARALKVSPPLKNDLIFLFTDGEEVGSMGAKAFLDEHPWAKDVGLVINFEARGSGGPAVLFETSDHNGGLIKEFARAATKPVASSLFYEVYRALPNKTDLTVFKDAGYPGLNFAYIGGHAHYHTLSDSMENMDQRSLQHQGTYALSLARHFGNSELNNLQQSNVVYFNLLGLTLIYYPVGWAMPLAVLVTLLLIGVLMLGLRRRVLTIGGIALGAITLLLTSLISAAVVTLVWMGVSALHSDYKLIPQGVTYNSNLYIASFVALTVAASATLYIWFGKKVSLQNLMGGSLLVWTMLMVLTSWLVPGASYLFTWPLLFSIVGLGFMIWRNQEPASPKTLLILCLCAAPAIILLFPVLYTLYIALPTSMAGAVSIVLALLLGLLIPHLKLMSAPKRWIVPVGAALLSLVFIVSGSLTAGFDQKHPKPVNLFYAVNADMGKAIWGSSDQRLDGWTSQFFAQHMERSAIEEYVPSSYTGFAHSPAPDAHLSPPSAALLSDSTNNNVRTLRLRIASPRQAPFISVSADASTEVIGASVNGKQINGSDTAPPAGGKVRWEMFYYAPPAEGIELALEVKPSQPVKLTLVDQSFELPAPLVASFGARPSNLMPTPFPFNPFGDSTLVSKTYTF